MNNINEIKNKTRNSIGINIVGFILTTMAGWVDTIGVLLLVNERSSSMTGRGHILGYWIYSLNLEMFLTVALIIISFITGACISTRISRKKGLIGGLILTGIFLLLGSAPFSLDHLVFSTIFLPLAMGSQNAATSLTEIKRSTHLTGATTDIGINIAKGNWKVVGFWMCRWVGFPLGSVIGFNLASLVEKNIINTSATLIGPAIIIIITGIMQNKYLDIPLLEEE